MNEQDIYRCWERGADQNVSLESESGESITVLGSGKRNTGSGPDYTGCILEFDHEIWTGDVEIHVEEADWIKHGHHHDPAFDHVQLHFFLHPSSQTIAEDQVRRTVEVDPERLSTRNDRRSTSDTATCTTLCPAGTKLRAFPDRVSNALEIIEQMGWERIQRRRQEVRSSWASARRLTHLSRLLCTSLGLHGNREPAGDVIDAVDVRWLRKRLRSFEDPARAQMFGEGVLLSRSGLLNNSSKGRRQQASRDWQIYNEQIQTLVPECPEVANKGAWDLSDVRPVNTPFRRLAGFVALFRRFFVRFSVDQVDTFLVNRVREIRKQAEGCEEDPIQGLTNLLTVTPDDVASYWNHHSHPQNDLPQPTALVGSHRAAIIWINGLFPYLLTLADKREWKGFKSDLRALMHNSSLPLGDRRTRTVKHQLFGSGSDEVRQTAVTDQGMHELFNSYCRYGPGGCSRCPVRDSVR